MKKTFLTDIAYEVRDLYEPRESESLPYVGLEHMYPNVLHLSGLGESSKHKVRRRDFGVKLIVGWVERSREGTVTAIEIQLKPNQTQRFFCLCLQRLRESSVRRSASPIRLRQFICDESPERRSASVRVTHGLECSHHCG